MTTPTTVRRSGIVPASVEATFEAALSLPLPQLYRRRFGPMPPIVAVHDQHGAWDTPGQTREFVLADQGRMHEEMLALTRPDRFANRLTILSGPFSSLVSQVDESWSFRAVGVTTEATWEWNLFPRSAPARLLLPVIGRLWYGYAGGVLAQLSEDVHTFGTAEA